MNKPNKYISNVQYIMNLGCGRDTWRIVGNVNGSPLMPATPISFDKNQDTFETLNSIYVIESYSCNKEKFWEQLDTDVKNNGFETY